MKAIKRWTSSVMASFDWMISQIENHEAMVNSAIQEASQASVRARARLNRVKTDGQAMRARLVELRSQADLWRDRAVQTARKDTDRATECLKRKRKVEREIAEAEANEREHARIEKNLNEDLAAVEAKLAQLRQQRNLMRTRQSRADAVKALHGPESGALSEIDEIFERWEVQIGECEAYGESSGEAKDELESEYSDEEESARLKVELESLLAGQSQPAKA